MASNIIHYHDQFVIALWYLVELIDIKFHILFGDMIIWMTSDELYYLYIHDIVLSVRFNMA